MSEPTPEDVEVRATEKILSEILEAIVLAIAFLNRDQGTERMATTVPQIVERLAGADIAIRALTKALSLSPSREEDRLRRVLREHWITGTGCDKGAGTNEASCFCSTWQGPKVGSPVAAAETWVKHVLSVLRATE